MADDTSTWIPPDFAQWFQLVSEAEWQEFLDYAEEKGYPYQEQKLLRTMVAKARSSRPPSWKQIRWAMQVRDKIQEEKDRDAFEDEYREEEDQGHVRHLTVRVAWHDNKWNGTVCRDPAGNRYCSGFRSLLSARIQRRKDCQKEASFAGQEVANIIEDGDYLPPCFWSINAFGEKSITIEHDNPAAPQLEHIKEDLPPRSVFSWPFALSFARDAMTRDRDGKYPKNLESVRIPHFQKKLKEKKSLVFLYANYDNPVSGDDRTYLVVGVGKLEEKGERLRFEKPASSFEKLRQKRDNQNFPNINWALRYTLAGPDNFVRLPYHEYLEEAEQTQNFDRLNAMKVTIEEPELVHCFKYVAMDIDDDESIYILTKIRQKLMLIKDEGVISPKLIEKDINKVDQFLGECWDKRGYFPGFEKLVSLVLERDDKEFRLATFRSNVKEEEGPEYPDTFVKLLEHPSADSSYKSFRSDLLDLQDRLEQSYRLSPKQFAQLCMLNLTRYQFERILLGKIKQDGHTSVQEICKNPYLLYEEYEPDEPSIDVNTGEQLDFPVELFKIDVAYFPHTMYLDRIDLQREMKYNDKKRIRALIIRYLRSLEDYGDCFDDARGVEKGLQAYPLFYARDEYRLPEDFLLRTKDTFDAHLSEKLEIVRENDTKYYYLQAIYGAEKYITNQVEKLLRAEDHEDAYEDSALYLDEACQLLRQQIANFDEEGFREEREVLYQDILRKRLYVLAGAPGSGKSHELLNIIRYLRDRGESYVLLTPTGKAALRLSTDKRFDGIKAKTIDKYLYEIKDKKSREYNNLIIDETSMVDLLKFEELLRAFNFDKPSFKRLILVGDPYQLPPIGYGKVFIDIINFLRRDVAYEHNYIELETNCRSESGGELLELSRFYSNHNIFPEELEDKIAQGGRITDELTISYWEDKNELYGQLKGALAELGTDEVELNAVLYRLFGLDQDGQVERDPQKSTLNLEGFQIITPYRADYYGTVHLNGFMQDEIKQGIGYVPGVKLSFKHADKVIQTKNIYHDKKLFLSNGSMGLVSSKGKKGMFHFAEREDPISCYDSRISEDNLELAYGITIHKAQGSGFDNVFLILPKKKALLSKELVYTALTRSRKRLYIFVEGQAGQPFEASLFEAVRTRSYTETRKTSLLGLPYWNFSLEPEKGVYVQSRVEYIIYQILQRYRSRYEGFAFDYERKPVIEDEQLQMKTDFTITTDSGAIYYWEHLGLLGNRYYERKWHYKREVYEKYGLLDALITTDERRGISEEKIVEVIEHIRRGLLENEDRTERYSKHHYSLR